MIAMPKPSLQPRNNWSTAGSVEANLEPIRQALGPLLGLSTTRRVLELASGFGQHICSWAAEHSRVSFRPTEFERQLTEQVDALVEAEELDNVAECRKLDIASEGDWERARSEGASNDVVIAINTVNVTNWSVTESLFANVGKVLSPEPHATLVLYAALKIGGLFRSPADEKFDAEIRSRDAAYGLRDLEALRSLGRKAGLELVERHAMPKGNWLLFFRRPQPDGAAGEQTIGPPASAFMHSIPSERYPAEAGRYHLYASLFCPFAGRALILRELKGLTDVISVSQTHWHKGIADEETGEYPGWHFESADECAGCVPDPLFGAKMLSEVYFRSDPTYGGRYSVPVLFDKQTGSIVSNDSAQIMRMLSTAFDNFCPPDRRGWTYAPEALRERIDAESSYMQEKLNAGVYKTGWAPSQSAYEERCRDVLDRYENMLKNSDGPFLLGKALTELDVRLFTTVVRFDPVYVRHFKVNVRQIRGATGYPQLHLWMRRLYHRVPAFRETLDWDHIKSNYFRSHLQSNPSGIVPIGPLPHVEDLSDAEAGSAPLQGWEGTPSA